MEGLIHSKRRNILAKEPLNQGVKPRKSLDAVLHHLLQWDIELVIDEPKPEPEVCEKLFIIVTQAYLAVVSQVPVEGRDTHMRERLTDRETEREKKRKKDRQRDPLDKRF